MGAITPEQQQPFGSDKLLSPLEWALHLTPHPVFHPSDHFIHVHYFLCTHMNILYVNPAMEHWFGLRVSGELSTREDSTSLGGCCWLTLRHQTRDHKSEAPESLPELYHTYPIVLVPLTVLNRLSSSQQWHQWVFPYPWDLQESPGPPEKECNHFWTLWTILVLRGPERQWWRHSQFQLCHLSVFKLGSTRNSKPTGKVF